MRLNWIVERGKSLGMAAVILPSLILALILAISLGVAAVGSSAAPEHARPGFSSSSEVDQIALGQTHTQSVLLKNRELQYSFRYPRGWQLSISPGGFVVTAQNLGEEQVSRLLAEGGDFPDGFIKVQFMVDPKTDPDNLIQGQGRSIAIDGREWRALTPVDSPGDFTRTLETAHSGVVFRVFEWVARTNGSTELLENHKATANQIVASVTLMPIIEHDRIPGAPTPPSDGKPEATPIGDPSWP